MLGPALMLAIAPIQSGATVDQAADRAECALCVRKIELDAARWNCLLRKRDALQGEAGDAVIVLLDEKSCNSQLARGRQTGAASRSGNHEIPVTDAVGTGLLILSKRQLICLANAPQATQARARINFDFEKQCGP